MYYGIVSRSSWLSMLELDSEAVAKGPIKFRSEQYVYLPPSLWRVGGRVGPGRTRDLSHIPRLMYSNLNNQKYVKGGNL